MKQPFVKVLRPDNLRRLADAIEAHDNAARELWMAARKGQDTKEQRDAYLRTRRERAAAAKATGLP